MKRKKKNNKVTINLDSVMIILKLISLVFAGWFLVWSFINFFIPIILNMVQGLLASVMIWKVSSNESIKFFGGLIFLFIGYKIYEILMGFWIYFFKISSDFAGKLFKEIMEK